jgi:Putative transposase/Transposase zinc-binding domain
MSADLEVADIFRRHGDAYRRAYERHLGRVERRVMSAIELCRTAELGGHTEVCSECGLVRCAYNSCRNRHCPKCQGLARAEWLAARQAELLPVPYFHVVFTLPAPVAEIAFQNKEAVYATLFRTAAETLRAIAADPKHLGAEIGLLAVPHTWGQSLHHHPHVHCVVPGGALDGTRWIGSAPASSCRSACSRASSADCSLTGCALPSRPANSRSSAISRASPSLPSLPADLASCGGSNGWSMPSPPFGGPAQVLAYLGRYTHRVAIANSRLLRLTDKEVAFRWKDYRHHGKSKVLTLEAHEFIRRFLLHTLPDGFHRIRHYGFLANGHRAAKLALCRKLLEAPPPNPASRSPDELVIRLRSIAAPAAAAR